MTERSRTLLIVEDDDDVREAVAIYFEIEGYRVRQAANGEEALDVLRQSPEVCVILLDLFMPVMDGWGFRHAQLADPTLAPIPVIVISADRFAAEKAQALGAVDCHGKPIDFPKLIESVTAHC